jgi:hypothetical protein
MESTLWKAELEFVLSRPLEYSHLTRYVLPQLLPEFLVLILSLKVTIRAKPHRILR